MTTFYGRTKKRFPVRWLTYRSRLSADLEVLYAQDLGSQIFNAEYLKQLSDQAVRQDDRLAKLILLNYTILAFLVLGYVSEDTTMSFLGISLKSTSAVREVLLASSATVAITVTMLSASRDILIWALESLVKLKSGPDFAEISLLSVPSSFGLKTYFAKSSSRYVFSSPFTRSLKLAAGVIFLGLFLILLATSISISFSVALQVYRAPALGGWSYAIFIYVIGSWLFMLLWFIWFHLPLPYSDKSELLATQTEKRAK